MKLRRTRRKTKEKWVVTLVAPEGDEDPAPSIIWQQTRNTNEGPDTQNRVLSSLMVILDGTYSTVSVDIKPERVNKQR